MYYSTGFDVSEKIKIPCWLKPNGLLFGTTGYNHFLWHRISC